MKVEDNLASYYDHEADKFHGTRQRHRPEFDLLAEEIRESFAKRKKIRVLEIGCGSGRLYGYLCKTFPSKEFDYTGIDISKSLIQIAKKDHPDASWKVDNMVSFLQKADQESYDLVIGIASFHHLSSARDRLITANSIYRSLAYDGLFFMTNRTDSDRFRKRFRGSIVSARWKSIVSFGIYRPNDLFLPRKNDAHEKIFSRYYHIFSLPELEKIGTAAGFGSIVQFYLTATGEKTMDKRHSRNSCSVRKKEVFVG